MGNAENNNIEMDYIEEDVIRVRYDLFKKNNSETSSSLTQVRRVIQKIRPILCLKNYVYVGLCNII